MAVDVPAISASHATITHDLIIAGRVMGSTAIGTVILANASIGGYLDCRGGVFTNDRGPALHADGLTTTNAYLGGDFTGPAELGAVRLLGASIGASWTATAASSPTPTAPHSPLTGSPPPAA